MNGFMLDTYSYHLLEMRILLGRTMMSFLPDWCLDFQKKKIVVEKRNGLIPLILPYVQPLPFSIAYHSVCS